MDAIVETWTARKNHYIMIWRDFHDSRQINSLSGAIKLLRAK
jgi:SRSO17 transposase